MKISAKIANARGAHSVVLTTNETERVLAIAPKPDGQGSSVNGGELLFLALATCYCNDIYREAKKRGIEIEQVTVDVSGEFGREGGSASNVSYRAQVKAKAPREQILELMRHTDSVAEIQNTLRSSQGVVLAGCDAVEVK